MMGIIYKKKSLFLCFMWLVSSFIGAMDLDVVEAKKSRKRVREDERSFVGVHSMGFASLPKRASHAKIFPQLCKTTLSNYAEGYKGQDGLVAKYGYGYKAGNLVELERIVDYINEILKESSQQITVEVPSFHAISTVEIKEYLKHYDCNIVEKWSQFTRFKKAIKANDNTLTPEAEAFLKEIQDQISAIFSTDVSSFSADKLMGFLESNVQGNSSVSFMVRSTGKEDTETLANAGGNESVPGVGPAIHDISHAMGVVVASYFSKKSLGQRLASATTDQEFNVIFDEEPFMPVLIQRMIGEQSGGAKIYQQIPVSGVMFTQEAEGRTHGITHIQTTYGHNEALVNSLVPVDTYYVDLQGSIHAIVRKKTRRLVPCIMQAAQEQAESCLRFMDNADELICQSSLTSDYLKVLKVIAASIERYYEKPMDVEFVIDRSLCKIFLVQARPIVYKATQQPSYLKDLSKIPDAKYKAVAVGTAGGSLRFITNKSQMIVMKDLPSALNNYLRRKDKRNIECVITEEMAPAISHEATTFRGQGVPVVCVKKINDFSDSNPSPEYPLVVDVQRGVIVQTAVENVKNNVVQNAWFSHPIPLQCSLLVGFQTNKQTVSAFLSRLYESCSVSTTYKQRSLLEFLEVLKEMTKEQHAQASSILLEIIHRVKKYIDENHDAMHSNVQKEFKSIIDHIIESCMYVDQAIQNASTPRSLEVLYAVKFLEAALYQDLTLDVVHGYSYKTALQAYKEDKEVEQLFSDVILKWPAGKYYLMQLMKGAKVAFTEEVRNQWINFIKDIACYGDAKLIVNILHRVNALQEAKIFDIWLNHDFMQYGSGVEHILISLNKDLAQSSAFIAFLTQKRNELEIFNVAKFQEQDCFEKQWRFFNEKILCHFLDGSHFVAHFTETGSLGKKAALVVMKLLVETFDHAIKAVTGAQGYNLEKKIERFGLMLEKFLGLLASWVSLPHSFEYCPGLIGSFGGASFVERKQIWLYNNQENAPGLQKILHDMRARSYPYTLSRAGTEYFLESREEELQVYVKPVREFGYSVQRKPFNVGALALGSESQTEMLAVSMEEFFTVVHQSLLNLVGNLLQSTGLNNMKKPIIVERMQQKLEEINVEGKGLTLIGTALEGTMLSFSYNMPLRQHSGLITLKYALSKQQGNKCILNVLLFGANEAPDTDKKFPRWNVIAELIRDFNERMKFPLEACSIKQTDGGVEFSWDITKEAEHQLVLEGIATIIEQSGEYSIHGAAAGIDEYTGILERIRRWLCARAHR